eukprot:EG_transcript_37720
MASYTATTLSAFNTSGLIRTHNVQRRKPTGNDVFIRIQFCGICHTERVRPLLPPPPSKKPPRAEFHELYPNVLHQEDTDKPNNHQPYSPKSSHESLWCPGHKKAGVHVWTKRSLPMTCTRCVGNGQSIATSP